MSSEHDTSDIGKSAAVVGCTGLVGSNLLDALLQRKLFQNVTAFSRSKLSTRQSNQLQTVQGDSSKWASEIPQIAKPDVFFSALGTTRARAGSFQAQYAIDHDLNLELARAAKDAGAKYYVLISSQGVSSSSMMPYSKMKGELEEAAQEIGFEKVVLVKPGLIVGSREDSRPAEAALRSLANLLGRMSGNRLKDFWAQDADVIGRAAVAAGLKCVEGSADVPAGKTWVLGMSDIVRLGRTEWDGGAGS